MQMREECGFKKSQLFVNWLSVIIKIAIDIKTWDKTQFDKWCKPPA